MHPAPGGHWMQNTSQIKALEDGSKKESNVIRSCFRNEGEYYHVIMLPCYHNIMVVVSLVMHWPGSNGPPGGVGPEKQYQK